MLRFFVKNIAFLVLFSWISFSAFAAEPAKESKFDPGELIMHHITDSHEWYFYSLKKADGTYKRYSIPLPVIAYSSVNGLKVFSFSRLLDNGEYVMIHNADGTVRDTGLSYNGYTINSERKLVSSDGTGFWDFSITKNVVQILISVTIIMLLFFSAAKRYAKFGTAAPKGMQNLLEVIIIFIRDEVARPILGKKADKYLPYLLTIFFFIWVNNLLGLVPGSANVTGNIAVTITLALFTFIITMFSSKKHYWKHIFAPSGVPIPVMAILVPVEVLGIFTKPFALLIRLFANMTAGHLIVLSFMSLIFIFAEMSAMAGAGMSVFSVAFAIFIYFLELLVAALQAYIFTILSALFIGEAAEEPAHHSPAHANHH